MEKRIVIRIEIPKMELEKVTRLMSAIEPMIADIEGARVDLTASSVLPVRR